MARVLIADDEPAIAASLEFLLRAAGHDISMARDGEEALAVAARLQPALIVLDLMLPRRNGLEVCRPLRADPHQSSVKVLMLTARGGKLDISGGLSSKRARINGTDSVRGGEILVKAQVPLSELEGYAAELKSITAGRGRYSLDFSHYEPVPVQVQSRLVDAYKPRHEEE